MQLRGVVLAVILLFMSGCATPGASGSAYLQCVPYARNVSGIQIYGNAHTWWHKAPKLSYMRGKSPEKGAVLVLSKTNYLEYGHVAVVKRVLSKRKIAVAHANWGNDLFGRGIIFENMEVQDVSNNNDWSKVRFWNPAHETYGYIYPASGFVYNKKRSI